MGTGLLAAGSFVAGGALVVWLWALTAGGLAQTGTVTLTVDCYSNPERTTITNDTDRLLHLVDFRLPSLYQPR